MQLALPIGRSHAQLDVQDDLLIPVRQESVAAPLLDPAAAVRAALETPMGFPALRRALTPDDHIAIVVDERLPNVAQLLIPVLEHVTGAGVAPEAISLVCAPSASRQEWLEDLPESFEEIHLEVHNPTDRKRLSYLALTKRGHRLYMNRTVVDADQIIVLAGQGYDPLLGYAGSEGALYPTLGDEASMQESLNRLSPAAPGRSPWPIRQEATEAAWLLGAPFFVHVVIGPGDKVTHVVAGLAETSAEAQRLHDSQWRRIVAQPAQTVIATIGGDPAKQTFDDMAGALLCAARVVQPKGRILLLCETAPGLGAGAELLREAEDPDKALELLTEARPADMAAAFQWACAAQQAHIFLMSGLPDDTAEELFAVPFHKVEQVQRLANEGGSFLVLNDAHRMLAVLES